MVTRALSAAAAAIAALTLAGCTPELDDRTFLVSGPRLLAIASSPAEAAPPAPVTLRALYVDENGERSLGDLEWAFCTARRSLTDQGTVSPECLEPAGEGLSPLGAGPSVAGTLPMDACRLFGPDRPEPMAGEPAGRPVDPDPSGGYYQPVRLLVRDGGDRYSIGATRIACGLSGATADVAADFGKRYRANESPAIAALAIVRQDSTETIAPDTVAKVKAGEKLTLRASWAACPTSPVCGDGICGNDETVQDCAADCTTPKGCSGAEPYLSFDPETRELASRREEIRVSWFVTAGELASDVVGRTADEVATKSEVENEWTAPTKAGEARLWLVIRDDRGGIGWEGYRIAVGD
ncbi:Hypothetical protein A7982_09116 [Minicystis rosea]|nr:Hypothetical protein A7982_09116 [Minicystis rosea]